MSEYFRKPIVKTLMLKGQEGQSIKGITKTSTNGFVDTYTITLTDGTTSTFTVTNGKEISSIKKTDTSGLVDTYTIKFNDGATSTFTVTNGKEISSISKTGTSGLVDTYTIKFNDGATSTFTVTNGDDSAYKPAVEALGKRIDNLIVQSGNESSAEVIDARTGYDGKSYDTLGTAIRSQVNNLNEDLDDLRIKSKNMFFVEKGEIINGIITVNAEKAGSVVNFKQNGQNTSNVNSLLMDISLEAGKKYTLSANRISGSYSSSGAITLGVYRRDNNSLAGSLNFSNVLKGSSLHTTFTADYTSYYIQLIFASTGSARSYDCDINLSLVEGENADYLEYGFNDIKKELPTIKYLMKHDIYDIIVAKDGTGNYTTVTEAVANCDDFSTIFVKNGVYDSEIIKAWLKTVFIIGESREGVIIKNNTGAYDTPPIEMGTGLLKNLTIYAENDGTNTPAHKGYALHSESSVEASVCNYFVLENCTFKSDYRQSWGLGMRGDTHYYVRNCYFDSVYFHDCEHAYRATKQNIEFDNCNLIGKGNRNGLLLQDQNMNGAEISIMFNRCLVKSENADDILYTKWNGSGVDRLTSLADMPNWSLSPFSFGNSNKSLNAN